MIDFTKIPYRLVALRADKGVSAYEVANKTGLGKATVHAHEHGTRLPNLIALVSYADYYGITVSELLGETTDGE